MAEPKKKRLRLKDTHRWTQLQTEALIQKVHEAVLHEYTKFEQPTAQKFYKTHCQHKALEGIGWKTMKCKMRYLKTIYMKAINWRDQVGSELFESDKAHVEARIKNICPYFKELNGIFEPMLSADPIRLTDNDFESYLGSMTKNHESDTDTDFEDSEINVTPNSIDPIVPKVEIDIDERCQRELEDATLRSTLKDKKSRANQAQRNFQDKEIAQELNEDSLHCATQFELDCMRLDFERKKMDFDLKYREKRQKISYLQLKFEKEKLEFEKRKFFEDQRLRKYEIDKQFEIKKMAIEKDERLQRLELEYKYRCKNLGDVIYNDKNDFN